MAPFCRCLKFLSIQKCVRDLQTPNPLARVDALIKTLYSHAPLPNGPFFSSRLRREITACCSNTQTHEGSGRVGTRCGDEVAGRVQRRHIRSPRWAERAIASLIGTRTRCIRERAAHSRAPSKLCSQRPRLQRIRTFCFVQSISVWRSWQRACFGNTRPQVRYLPPRPTLSVRLGVAVAQWQSRGL